MTDRNWNATRYHEISAPQQAWAAEQFERLALVDGESVLDAGCGSGKITAQLVEMTPHGRVYGVDAAASMVAHASAELGERAVILHQDLTELKLPEEVDAIFSNATFHWIKDHPRLFAALLAALKPGGRLVAQCGGEGNIDHFRKIAEELIEEPSYAGYFTDHPWNYAGAEVTASRLTDAGFVDVQTWLEPKPTVLEDPREFITTVCLLPHLSQLPEELREPFVDEVLERTGVPLTLDYVRLNMVATKPR